MKKLAVAVLLSLPAFGQSFPHNVLDAIRGPYAAKPEPPVNFNNSQRVSDLIRAGNLYLTLADAIALTIENNLDVEISRFTIPEAATDVLRAKGGGTLRGVDLTASFLAQGVGGPASPLLNGAASTATPSTAVPATVTELSALSSSQSSLAVIIDPYSAGPPVPMFDPALVGGVTWQHQLLPENTAAVSGGNTLISNTITSSLTLQQGFSTGIQYSLGFNSTTENENSKLSTYNPSTSGGLNLTVTQPLLRGFGPAVNRRFIRIAKNNERIGSAVFRQQLINAIFSVSQLYYDLVSLNEDLRVKQDTLRAARSLYDNTKTGVDEGTLAPLELTRAEAEVAGAEQDLVNSQGLLAEEEVIVKNVLTHSRAAEGDMRSVHIIPTEPLEVPQQEPALLADQLLAEAYANRPDLTVAGVQIDNSQIYLKASRNELLPELDLVLLGQSNGLAGQANSAAMISSAGQGTSGVSVEQSQVGGYGNFLGQVSSLKFPTYGVGLQLNLPIRNRIAQADVQRDELQFRQAQARLQQFRKQAELEVDDAIIGLQRARAAYDAAVKTRKLQAQALDTELVRYENGVDTAFFVIQYQSYLAQARSTEVVAKGNYFKARAALDRAIGASLATNNISFDEGVHGRISRPPAALPSPEKKALP